MAMMMLRIVTMSVTMYINSVVAPRGIPSVLFGCHDNDGDGDDEKSNIGTVR